MLLHVCMLAVVHCQVVAHAACELQGLVMPDAMYFVAVAGICLECTSTFQAMFHMYASMTLMQILSQHVCLAVCTLFADSNSEWMPCLPCHYACKDGGSDVNWCVSRCCCANTDQL